MRDIYPQGKNDDAKMWGKLPQTDRKTAGQSNDSACSFYDTTLFSYLKESFSAVLRKMIACHMAILARETSTAMTHGRQTSQKGKENGNSSTCNNCDENANQYFDITLLTSIWQLNEWMFYKQFFCPCFCFCFFFSF